MIAGYGLNALLTFGYMFVSNPTQLFLLQIGLGIAEALSAPIWDSLFAALSPNSDFKNPQISSIKELELLDFICVAMIVFVRAFGN